jgi:sugar phosphate isomerase/epimerase
MKAILLLSIVSSIITASATSSFAADSAGIGSDFKGPVGLQLYSLRAQFAKDVPGTLDKVKAFGIVNVELAGTYGLSNAAFMKQLEARGLKARSAHFDYNRFRTEPEAVAQEAKALGLEYAGCAWIPHSGTFDEKACRDTIAVFNKAGEVLAKHGVKFFYHTHGYEFSPLGDGTVFDLLMKETDPKNVSYEMDIFWVVHAGQDAAKLLEKYGSRWQLMHLKDMKKSTPTGLLTGSSDVSNDVTLGEGKIDLVSILRAAKKVGVKYYFIEDESPTSEQQIPQSLKYLEQVKL